jgi:hypothetical protein
MCLELRRPHSLGRWPVGPLAHSSPVPDLHTGCLRAAISRYSMHAMSLLLATGRAIDRIKINELVRQEHDGRVFWLKRRHIGARAVISMANVFFRLAGNPVTVLADTKSWQHRERHCMALLHGPAFETCVDAAGWLHLQELPGSSVTQHIAAGTESESIFEAAARELRRAHELPCPSFGAAWSHGDPHSGNFIYDPASDRARLMDFEVQHHTRLPAAIRHADDLLVFLQDTLGRLPRERWLELAEVFVRAYGNAEITAHLVERLAAPRGFSRIWWAVRTTYLAPRELETRLSALRSALVA